MKISTLFALALAAAPAVSAFGPLPAGSHARTIHSSSLFAESTDTSTSTPPVTKKQPLIMVDDECGEDAIVPPSVIREAAVEQLTVDENFFDNLPYGVKLTGADKLRAEGLTGKGVKVAVIDSGVDNEHPGFHDMVKQQMWLRYGSPLSEDDHGMCFNELYFCLFHENE